MKKTVSLIIAASLLVTLAACGGKSTATNTASPSPAAVESASATDVSPSANSDSPFAGYGTQGYTHTAIAAAISPYLVDKGMNAIADQSPAGKASDKGTTLYVYNLTDLQPLYIYEYNGSVVSISLVMGAQAATDATREQFSYTCITLLGAFEGDDMSSYAEQLQVTETQQCTNTAQSTHCSYSYVVDDAGMSIFTVLVF